MKLTADFSGKVLLREAHYGEYTLNGWKAAPKGESVNGLYFTAEAYKYVDRQKNNVTIELLSGAPYVIPYYPEMSDINSSLREYSISAYRGSLEGLEHSAEWKALEEAYRKFVHKNYTDLPQSTITSMLEILGEALKGTSITPGNNLEFIYWVEEYVRNAAPYDLEGGAPDGVDTAVWFLTDPDASGVCRHFATAATALYRAAGVPARYVVGYSGSAAENETVTVTADRGHAWVEVYLDGIGWITVDPTGASNDGGDNGGNGDNNDGEEEEEIEIIDIYIEFADDEIKIKYNGEIQRPSIENLDAPRKKPSSETTDSDSFDDVYMILENAYLEYEFYGERKDIGSVTVGVSKVFAYDLETDEDISERFRFHIDDTAVLTITQIELPLVSGSKTVALDEMASGGLVFPSLSKQEDVDKILLYGHKIVTDFSAGVQNGVGRSDNKFTARVVDSKNGNKDVTGIYNIKYSYGKLTVAYDRLYYQTASDSKVYDGKTLSAGIGISELQNPIAGKFEIGHTVISVTNASITEPGTIVNKPTLVIHDANGTDISHLYIIDNTYLGRLTVEQIEITIKAGSKTEQYVPGIKVDCDSYEITVGELLEGHTAELTYIGSLSSPGKCDTSIKTAIIRDANGKDVTKYYKIKTESGLIEIIV